MLKTPEEARDVQCCGGGDCGEYREPTIPAYEFKPGPEIVVPLLRRRYCIADQCMAWRWSVEFFDRNTGKTLQEGETIAQDRLGERLSGRGHCGLAGRP